MNTEAGNYIFREADEADFAGMAELLYRHNYAPKGLSWSQQEYIGWLRWKFLRNPDGMGRIFIVEDLNNIIVGLRAILPRFFSSAGTGPFLAYHGVDELIDERLRKKGLYKKLRGLSMSILPDTFGFPGDISLRVIVHQGYRVMKLNQKWRFPVAPGGAIAGKPYGFVGRAANSAAKLYAFAWLGKYPRNLRVEPVDRFERDFDVTDEFVRGVRSAAYLNWRFIDNPMYSYSAYEIFERDESIGYFVYTLRSSKAEIYDFVAMRRERGCLRLMIEHFRSRGIDHLRFRGLGLRLGKFGFIPSRDSGGNCVVSDKLPYAHWIFTLGDRDY